MVVFLVCVLQVGDGVGGSEISLGTGLTAHACVIACQKRKISDESINGVTVHASLKSGCWCEKNMSRIETNLQMYNACFFEGKTLNNFLIY